MSGQVEVLAAFDPDRLQLRDVAMGTTHTRTVELAGKRVSELRLGELISSKPEQLSAELEKVDGKQRLKVTFHAGDREGHFSGQITAKSGLDKPSELKLYVWAQVTGDIVVDRRHAVFAPYDANSPPVFTVTASSLSGKPFRIKRVEDSSGQVDGKATQADSNWRVELRLTGEPKSRRGKVLLHTDRKAQPSVAVPYSVRDKLRRLPGPLRPTMGSDRPPRPPLGLKTTPEGQRGKLRLKTNPAMKRRPLPTQKPPAPAPAPAPAPKRP